MLYPDGREENGLVDRVFEKCVEDPDFLVRLAEAIDGVVKELDEE